MPSPLNKKLYRDLWRLRGQALAVAMVVASGVAVLVMSLTTVEALEETSQAYYERYRFAHIFADLKRAPERLAHRIAAIPGVQAVQTRISHLAILDIEGFAEPVIGRVLSIPESGEPTLNHLALRAGRFVAPGRPDEVVISEPFADAHGLGPGDTLKAILNGNKRTLRVVGVALSPEFVYALGPGSLMPDDQRFGILWMGRKALEAAFDLDGAFNDVSLALLRGTPRQPVIEALDQLLARHGGIGAVARKDQISNWFLMSEIAQLRSLSGMLPVIFLGVAAFLTNMVLARLIATERSEIGLIKAFGYSDTHVAWHYTKMALAMAGMGVIFGWIVGAWLGHVGTVLYAEIYRFPLLVFHPGPKAFVVGALVSILAALAGTLGSVRQAAALPPAEAVRPPAPPVYTRGGLSGSAAAKWIDQPTRIVLRQILRWPLRSAFTVIGISLSVGVLIMAMQWMDAIEHMAYTYFVDTQRQDLTVGLAEAQSSTTVYELLRMPGVLEAERMRIVSADLTAGRRSHRGQLEGRLPDAQLNLVYDVSGRTVREPPDGLILSTKLAEKLQVGVGDTVHVEVLTRSRPVRDIPVVGLVETYIGISAYIHLAALDRMLRERPSVEYLNLLVDKPELPALFRELKNSPEVSSVMVTAAARNTFYDTLGDTIMVWVRFFVGFACTLAFGVVYNSARIALSERGRELATLRVLGFRRSEISYILLGEVGLLVFAGVALGCLVGRGLAELMSQTFETELYRVPPIIDPPTYGWSVLIALAAAVLSAAVVQRRLGRLDLVAVLKTRE